MNTGQLRLFTLTLCLCLCACQPPPALPESTAAAPTPAASSLPAGTPTASPTFTPAVPPASPTPEFAVHTILGDLRVRQAIAHCTDRAALVRSVYPWLGEPQALAADSLVPPSHWAYAGGAVDISRYPFAPEQGMALLDQAGWKLASGAAYRANPNGDELALTLTTSDSNFRRSWIAVWAEQMRACGIHIQLNPQPAEWFFGEDTGLSRREFELAAFAWQDEFNFGVLEAYSHYACEQIPTLGNGWQGRNFSGWCSPAVETALQDAAGSLDPAVQRQTLQRLQVEYTHELPELPLFYRLSLFAANPALENFDPPGDGMHTWNAAAWRIPGRDTIVIGEDGEPAAPLWFEQAYVAGVIRTLIMGSDFVQKDGAYQPVMLKSLPALDTGGVQQRLAVVKPGDRVLDWRGEVVELQPGVEFWDADGYKRVYGGGDLALRQLLVTYEFVDGLIWSDGTPVSAADYELGYRALCDPDRRGAGSFDANFPDPAPACERVASVDFLSDTAYRVTWLPGFTGARMVYADLPFFLPPFSRLPAHQLVSDGRKLADVPLSQWSGLDEVRRSPQGAGPYVLKEWVYGQGMSLEANPYYFAGPPATPRIQVRFLEHSLALRAFAEGEVDILDWETISPEDVETFALAQAQQEGRVRLVTLPAAAWELLAFSLRK